VSAVKDQTLVLKSSKTEKDVFYVTATIDVETESATWGKFRAFWEWTGEIRNGATMCNIDGVLNSLTSASPGSSSVHGTAKGTFSKRRASGTVQVSGEGSSRYGKWTAERIS